MPTLAERHVSLLLKRSPDARLVRFGALSGYGVIDTNDETVDDGNGAGVRRRSTEVTLPTDAFPALVEGDTLRVFASRLSTSTATSYVVRDRLLMDDGLIVRYAVVPA
jgi:hypothetical protein